MDLMILRVFYNLIDYKIPRSSTKISSLVEKKGTLLILLLMKMQV